MSAKPYDDRRMRGFVIVGYAALVVLVVGIGGWGAVARISGAVIAQGTVEVEGNRQVVQHPTGGVISAIHARDGDAVEEGDILVELDGDELKTELGIVEGQYFEILARKSRLWAERDGLDAVVFDPELLDRAERNPGIQTLMKAQVEQFEARMTMQQEQTAQLQERQIQIGNQINGLESLREATRSQIELISREISGQEALLAQGLTQITRVLTPQRELANLHGTSGQSEASIAENRGRIAEIEIERVRLDAELREEAISDLRDQEFREIELRERRRSLLDQIARLFLRAPVTGVVYGSTADTLRGVIRSAEPILYIVPQDSPLIVRSRLEAMNIDQVHIGQEAVLKFTAFDSRTTPEVTGNVTAVSADIFEDERQGLRYYRVDIRLDQKMFTEFGGRAIVPGMPVEAYVQTAERSALSYFLNPFTEYFDRAFRDG